MFKMIEVNERLKASIDYFQWKNMESIPVKEPDDIGSLMARSSKRNSSAAYNDLIISHPEFLLGL